MNNWWGTLIWTLAAVGSYAGVVYFAGWYAEKFVNPKYA